MSPQRPTLQLEGNIIENFRNFELRFNDYCIQADYRDLTKDTDNPEHYNKPLLELAALRSSLPDDALQVIRYTIEPQIPDSDKKKPWIWMKKLHEHYVGIAGHTLMADRFQFWNIYQTNHETIQEWEVRVRKHGTLCDYKTQDEIWST